MACPNVIGHPIIGYDFDQFQDVWKVLQVIRMLVKNHSVSNFHLILIFSTLKRLLKWYVNSRTYFLQTLPLTHIPTSFRSTSAILFDTWHASTPWEMRSSWMRTASKPLIRPKGGFGGLSGPSVKYTALANVKKLRELLRKDIDVIGVGGVRTLVF